MSRDPGGHRAIWREYDIIDRPQCGPRFGRQRAASRAREQQSKIAESPAEPLDRDPVFLDDLELDCEHHRATGRVLAVHAEKRRRRLA